MGTNVSGRAGEFEVMALLSNTELIKQVVENGAAISIQNFPFECTHTQKFQRYLMVGIHFPSR